jgi:hypothetical protein
VLRVNDAAFRLRDDPPISNHSHDIARARFGENIDFTTAGTTINAALCRGSTRADQLEHLCKKPRFELEAFTMHPVGSVHRLA